MSRLFLKYYFFNDEQNEWQHYKPGKHNGYTSLKIPDSLVETIKKRPATRGLSQSPEEAYLLYSSVRDTAALEGALAEVGVNQGGSAIIICQAKGNTPLFLCDTFEGMPNERVDPSIDHWRTDIRTHTLTSFDSVQKYVGDYPNVHLIKGVFPDSIAQHPEFDLPNQRFKLVHLDVDLYRCTLDCLEWFWPRLVSGGRIISHNYNLTGGHGGNTPGVKKAFEEYFSENRHHIVEVAETQCLVIKP